jgi:tetratricopeptide (TPR) repeat protein
LQLSGPGGHTKAASNPHRNVGLVISPAAEKLLQDAIAQHRQGNIGAAMDRYMKVLQEDPRQPDALFYVAVVVVQDGQFDKGIELAERALSLGPPPGMPQARLHNLLGQTHMHKGDNEKALAAFDRAIALASDYADAHGNRGLLLSDMGDLNGAMVSLDNALMLRRDSVEDWCNRGAVLQWLNRAEEALRSFDNALAIRPDFAGGHFNRGNALRDLGQIEDAAGRAPDDLLDQADAAHTRAIELAPEFADAHLGRALVRLLRGRWTEGWRDYEHRVKAGPPTFRPLDHPRWKGEPLPAGHCLVLVAEQGLGDTINVCRFAPVLAARGFDVTLLVRPSMKALLSTLPGSVRIATSPEELAADKRPLRWLPMMSVPGLLGVTPETIPADIPYLSADPRRVAWWGRHFGPGGFKVGINWGSGHTFNHHFRRRDIPLASFAPLAALSGVRLVALQKGVTLEQVSAAPFRDRIEIPNHDPDNNPDAFLDLAAILMDLDLVITCDTSVAHLAGALARPTLLMLPAVADWRWLLGRHDTPWYPTVRLIRQKKPGDWGAAVDEVVDTVKAKLRPN